MLTSQHATRGYRRKILEPSLTIIGKKRKDMGNLFVEPDKLLGVVKMNREHRYNLLTEGMISDISRGLESQYNNHHAHVIYWTSAKNQHWCNGTDFKTIAHMKKEDAHGRIQKYMEELYRL